MTVITPAEIKEAAETIGIGEKASLNDIRKKYHEHIRKLHPDVSQQDPAVSHETTVRLNRAYELLTSYCMNYLLSFRIEDISDDLHDPERSYEDFWAERFGDDPIWG